MDHTTPQTDEPPYSPALEGGAVNASLIYDGSDGAFLRASLAKAGQSPTFVVVSDDKDFAARLSQCKRLSFNDVGLSDVPLRYDHVRAQLALALNDLASPLSVVVDMRWGMSSVSASANFERWGGQCDRLVSQLGATLICVYERSLLIEDQLLAALYGHSHFLSPAGFYPNPYWLPPELQSGASLTKQLSYLLERIVPEYAGIVVDHGASDGAASGANPGWLKEKTRITPRSRSDETWKIRCFGRLRVYLSDGTQMRWDISGSAPKKSKTLFAHLLQNGERGVPAAQLAELLWPDEAHEETKRARLHHAVAMLRKTLGGAGYVVRTGEYYSLAPPPGTWIDVVSFEQLCQRSKVLAKSKQDEDALQLLDAADRLYTGELFEDLPDRYLQSELNDWVFPRRVWFKEMALKVMRDKAEILRRQGRLREALECCQRALNAEPSCEIAHAEMMKIFNAQGRSDAVTRQYRQYKATMVSIGVLSGMKEMDLLYQRLLQIDESKRI